MIRILLYALLIWFLYNLIFRFIVPIYKTTRQMKQKFMKMGQQMEDHENKQQGHSENTSSPKTTSQKPTGDYIDFEEVK
jgi:hypothetical protein